MRGHAARHAAKRNDVFEQAAEIGMVHDFGGRGALVAAGGFGIGDDAENQLFEPRVGNGFGIAAQLHEHFFDVGGRVREIVGEIDFFWLGEAQLLHRELRAIAIDLDSGLHFDEIVAIYVFCGGFKLVPHAGFDGAAAVAELQAEIRAAFARVAQFLFMHEEKSGDALLSQKIGDERRLHWPEAGFFPNKRYFL